MSREAFNMSRTDALKTISLALGVIAFAYFVVLSFDSSPFSLDQTKDAYETGLEGTVRYITAAKEMCGELCNGTALAR